MNKLFSILLVIVGLYLAFTVLLTGWKLLFLVAALLALGSLTGAIGRWGYGLAGLLALIAIPSLMFSAVATAMALLIKLAPLLLVVFGIYALVKAFR